MKWVTRERPKIDRIACPWLIARFIDKEPEFLYVPAAQVLETAEKTGAVPYDIPGVEMSHEGEFCSFDAFLKSTSSPTRPCINWPLSSAGRTPHASDWRHRQQASTPCPWACLRSLPTTTRCSSTAWSCTTHFMLGARVARRKLTTGHQTWPNWRSRTPAQMNRLRSKVQAAQVCTA